MTREEQERERCEAELQKPGGDFLALLGWADWAIEQQLLTPTQE